MLDRVEAALHHWQRIRPAPEKPISTRSVNEASAWLERVVCPIADTLISRADFRDLARWPLDHLVPGARSRSRKLIEAVDVGLRRWAEHLAVTIRRHVGSDYTGSSSATEFTTCSSPGREAHQLPLEASLSRIEFVRSRPWNDLCSELDYFGPAMHLNLKEEFISRNQRGQRVGHGGFLPLLNRDWNQPGDFVSRCVLVRIKHWEDQLRRESNHVQRHLADAAGLMPKTAWQGLPDFQGEVAQLRSLIQDGPEAALRDAAMTLVQVYAAYRPMAELNWLGNVGKLARWAECLRWRLENHGDLSAPDAAAADLAELKPLFLGTDIDAFVRQMARERQLCLLQRDGRKELWWDGEPRDIDWDTHKRAWIALRILVECAKSGQGIKDVDVTDVSIWDARKDLKKLLPGDLFDKIKSRDRVHRLHLAPEAIYAAHLEPNFRLVEITGRVTVTADRARR